MRLHDLTFDIKKCYTHDPQMREFPIIIRSMANDLKKKKSRRLAGRLT